MMTPGERERMKQLVILIQTETDVVKLNALANELLRLVNDKVVGNIPSNAPAPKLKPS